MRGCSLIVELWLSSFARCLRRNNSQERETGDSQAAENPTTRLQGAEDDNPLIGGLADLPTLTPGQAVNTETLALNQTGSFQIVAYVDTNHNGQRDTTETGAALPLILVGVTPSSNQSLTLQTLPPQWGRVGGCRARRSQRGASISRIMRNPACNSTPR